MALGDRADEPASTYSGGMRRRIEIARVLLHEPTLLLLDEPGRGVDPEALRRIWDEIAALAAARATAVIVTTHQPEEAERCHRIAILDGGRVAATGTPDELRAHVARRRGARARRAPRRAARHHHRAAVARGPRRRRRRRRRGAARPRAGAAHRRAVPARPDRRHRHQPADAGRRVRQADRQGAVVDGQVGRERLCRRSPCAASVPGPRSRARPAPLLPAAEPHRRVRRAAADPVGGAGRRLHRQLPPRRRRRRRLPAVLLSGRGRADAAVHGDLLDHLGDRGPPPRLPAGGAGGARVAHRAGAGQEPGRRRHRQHPGRDPALAGAAGRVPAVVDELAAARPRHPAGGARLHRARVRDGVVDRLDAGLSRHHERGARSPSGCCRARCSRPLATAAGWRR